ncbi:MAG TPA: flagellar protein FlgN [Ectothiorhodospiraceae bacterium]|nr:flagellar protein FlgN [Ectothiorhodospiraceae bacterium]
MVVQQISQLMDEELRQTAQLRLILVEEQEAVKTKNIDAMNGTLTRKLEVLEKLEKLDTERKSLLQQAGYESSKSGFESLLQTTASSDVLMEKWHELEQEMAECRELHQINTQILEIGQRQVQQVLGVLLGNQGEEVDTYDQTGSKNASLTTHTYVKA